MENQNQMQAAKPNEVVAVLNQAQPTQIAQLDFVKQKFVDNYNLSHPGSMGEMVYHQWGNYEEKIKPVWLYILP